MSLLSTWFGTNCSCFHVDRVLKRAENLFTSLFDRVLCSSCPLGIHRSNELTEVRDSTWKKCSLPLLNAMSGRWLTRSRWTLLVSRNL
ncbi:hypothetical protein CEXT_670551 [Caerostris extrusa]|uniref:Uncharacterized protein n=1 Tax=Caerostris extrusa TaxID=172846 RepID=A0AAV4PJB2_CAEEX|nr:hypothetical protein CEXT_670551 [Caerostris extrusa]